MLSVWAAIAVAAALILNGGMAGLFYAFSVSVMPGLDATNAANAIPSMQSINRKIQNPIFFVAFFFAPVSALIAGGLLIWLDETGAAFAAFGAVAAYLLGVFAPTVVVNVPLNEALDTVNAPADPTAAARRWSDYSTRWTRWNHLRTLFCTLSLALIGLALYVWGR